MLLQLFDGKGVLRRNKHKMVYCRKHKTEYHINIAYFRRMESKHTVCFPSGKAETTN